MDEKKIGKILYYLSSNCRLTTKKLGQFLRRRQQVASYMVNTLKTKGIVKDFRAIIDPARLGLINVYVLYNFRSFNEKKIKNLIEKLTQHPYIITVDRLSQGADLLIEYSVPNLSLFNKQHRELLHSHKVVLQESDIYVVIVKHIFERKYLVEHPKYDEVIICGDRDIFKLNIRQKKVVSAFAKNAKEPITNISRELGLDPKTVVLLKKHLEYRKIILKYSITLDYELASVKRSYIFLQLAYEDIDEIRKLINYTKRHKNIIGTFKIIGDYELMLIVERKNPEDNVIRDIRKNFHISKYRIIESDKVEKEEYMPREF